MRVTKIQTRLNSLQKCVILSDGKRRNFSVLLTVKVRAGLARKVINHFEWFRRGASGWNSEFFNRNSQIELLGNFKRLRISASATMPFEELQINALIYCFLKYRWWKKQKQKQFHKTLKCFDLQTVRVNLKSRSPCFPGSPKYFGKFGLPNSRLEGACSPGEEPAYRQPWRAHREPRDPQHWITLRQIELDCGQANGSGSVWARSIPRSIEDHWETPGSQPATNTLN